MSDLIFKNIDKELEKTINDCLKGKKLVVTKFGNVKIHKDGYYHITSRKEEHNLKLLHRLIWEDYYSKPVPEGYDIHHINGNKLDNRIQNLQCVEHILHMSFHNKGKNHHYWGQKRPEHSEKMTGENNPNAKYTLWDIQSVNYIKGNMFNGGREPNPCKCCGYKYKGNKLPIGLFHDFVSVEIINDLVLDAIGDEYDK